MRFSKFYFLLLLAVFTASSAFSESITPTQLTSAYKVEGGGSIVMTDYVLVMTVNDPDDTIRKFTIQNAKGQLVLEVDGCNNDQCDRDLSSLGSGSYMVTVYTDNNDRFMGMVEL